MEDDTPSQKTSRLLKVSPLPKEVTIRGIVDKWLAQLKETVKKKRIPIAFKKKGRGRGKGKTPRPPGTDTTRKTRSNENW